VREAPDTYEFAAQPGELAGVAVALPPVAVPIVSPKHVVNVAVSVAAVAGMLKLAGFVVLVMPSDHALNPAPPDGVAVAVKDSPAMNLPAAQVPLCAGLRDTEPLPTDAVVNVRH